MADVKFQIVQADLTSGSPAANLDITISGFGTPDAVICFSAFATGSGGFRNFIQESFGFAANGSPIEQRCIANNADANGGASSNTAVYHSTSSLIRHTNAQGTQTWGEFQVTDFITDGVRLQEVAGNGVAIRCFFILIGGTDVANAAVNNTALSSSGSPAITDITTLGFEPDLVFAMGHDSGTLDSHLSTLRLNLGVAINDGIDTQKTLTIQAQDAQSRGAADTVITDGYILHPVGFNEVGTRQLVKVQDFDASGFSFRQEEGQLATQVSYLALRFTNNPGISLFDFDWPTSGNLDVSAPGFQPNFALLWSLFGPRNRNEPTYVRGMGLHTTAFDSQTTSPLNSNIWTSVSLMQDDVASISGGQGWFNDASLYDPEQDLIAQSSAYSFDSFGFDLTLSTNPPFPILGFGLAIGTTAAASPTPKPSPEPPASEGARFENNTIISANPQTFDESPIIGSPADVAYIWTANLTRIKNNSFLYDESIGGHAVKIEKTGQYNWVGNQFTGKWLSGNSPDGNATADAAIYNEVGVVILDITGGGDTPTFLDKQSPGTTINNNISVTITNLQPDTEVRVFLAEDSTSPIDVNEIAPGVEDSGSPSEFTFTAPAGTIVDIVIHNIQYTLPPNNRIKNFTVPTTDTSFPVTQLPDVNFRNP